jgi:hypothetical protein
LPFWAPAVVFSPIQRPTSLRTELAPFFIRRVKPTSSILPSEQVKQRPLSPEIPLQFVGVCGIPFTETLVAVALAILTSLDVHLNDGFFTTPAATAALAMHPASCFTGLEIHRGTA